MDGNLSNSKKKNLIIVLILLLIATIGIITIISLNKDKELKPSDNNVITPDTSETTEIKNEIEVLEDGKIEVTNFKITYNEKDKQWYLSMTIHNSSDKNIDLSDYNLILYEDKQQLVSFEGSVLGNVKAKSKVTSIIALGENFKNTNYLEIIKK